MIYERDGGLDDKANAVPDISWWFFFLHQNRRRAFVRGWSLICVAENMMRLAVRRGEDPFQMQKREQWIDSYMRAALRASKNARRYMRFYQEGRIYKK